MGLTRQPQYLAKIDRGNPITFGIVDVIIPADRVSSGAVQATFGTNGNVTYPARPQGRAMLVSAATSTDYQVYGTNAGPLVRAGPLTILSYYRLISIPSGAQRIAGTLASGGGSGYGIAPNGANFRFLTGNGVARIAVGAAVTTLPKVDVGTIDAAGLMLFYENGALTVTLAAGSNSASGAGAAEFRIGTTGTTDNAAPAEHFLDIVWDRVLTAAEIKALSANPWQIFQAPRRALFAPPAANGSTGTVAYTNANDTSNASGTTAVLGTSAQTNANDTSAASGTTTVTGASATTNADDAGAASGAVGDAITGTSSTTNANDTGDAAGTTIVQGTVARTNANDTSAASGTTSIVGTVAYSNANDIGAASGVADAITGTAVCTNANDTCAAQGVGAPSQDASSGGFFELPRMKRTRTVEEERERLGIIPKKVKQIIKAVAAASVQEVKTDDQAERQLAQRLAAQDIEAQARFAEFMRLERDRLLSRDIEIALRIKAKQQADDEDEREVEMLLM